MRASRSGGFKHSCRRLGRCMQKSPAQCNESVAVSRAFGCVAASLPYPWQVGHYGLEPSRRAQIPGVRMRRALADARAQSEARLQTAGLAAGTHDPIHLSHWTLSYPQDPCCSSVYVVPPSTTSTCRTGREGEWSQKRGGEKRGVRARAQRIQSGRDSGSVLIRLRLRRDRQVASNWRRK